MKNSRRSFLAQSGLLTATALGAPHLARASETILSQPGQTPKRVIMMVSDGMSMGTFTGADHFSLLTRNRPTTWRRLLNQPETVTGLMNMRALNAIVPDSAAAASKWGSGALVVNGAVNHFPDGTGLKPLCEVLGDAGWQRGLVTTTEITHATPAGFAASVSSRDLADTIAEQYLEHRLDVLLGGGSDKFDASKRKDQRDLFADYAQAGYSLLRTAEDLRTAPLDRRWLGTFTSGHIPFLVDHQNDAAHHKAVPRLAAMTKRALEKLANAEHFFLLVEGGRVDQACHNCDIAGAMREQIAFDEAIDVVLEFQHQHPDTLVVLTTDHGCGNPGVNAIGGAYARSSPLFKNVAAMKCSVATMIQQMGTEPSVDQIQTVFREATNGYKISERRASLLAPFLARKGSTLYDVMNSAVVQVGQLLANHLAVGWTGSTHSADYVLVTARGPGAENFRGFINGTDVFDQCLTFADVDFRNPQLPVTDGFALQSAALENTDDYLRVMA
ncbi:MAG: alkaline phosphatase [Verrucomicrobiae bacterium]|nr:alkaline phosphatase [Verrucomicrobiae bacterium]